MNAPPRPLELDPVRARRIVSHLASTGTPPDEGIDAFSVGLDGILGVLDDEYLAFLGHGLSAFKLVVGAYGGGKTHLLLSIRERAFRRGAAVAYLTLNPQESPFDKLELVYRRIADRLEAPPEPGARAEAGLEAVLRAWARRWLADAEGDAKAATARANEALAGLESTSVRNALVGAFRALLDDDEEAFSGLLLHLKAEGSEREMLRRYQVFEPIDRTTAFRTIRSLVRFLRAIGMSGLVLLVDEAERVVSLASSRNQRAAVDNLRQFIDECGGSALEGVLLCYAVPRAELLFGSGGGAVYEALRQRVRGHFREVNPTGVTIDLERLDLPPTRFLTLLGERLAALYAQAYEVSWQEEALTATIGCLVEAAWERRYGDEGVRRLFVKACLEALHRLRRDPERALSEGDAEAIVGGQAGAALDDDPVHDDQEF